MMMTAAPLAPDEKPRPLRGGKSLKRMHKTVKALQAEDRAQTAKSPSVPYTQELADTIINKLAAGEMLTDIIAEPGTPNMSNVFLWMREHKDFADRYQEARRQFATSLVERMVTETEREDRPEQAGLVRVKNEARRWVASKFNPETFGDTRKIDITGEIRHTHSLNLTTEQKTRIAQEWIMAETGKKEPILIEGTTETTGPAKKPIKKATKPK